MKINKHGSFYIRNGWPTKILDAVSYDKMIFSPNNELKAIDTIGAGRVMIKSMRYWATALGLCNEMKGQQGVVQEYTELGELIADNDPYCQDPGTLWILHRNLACNIEDATAWYWAFNELNVKSFTKESFVHEFDAYLKTNGEKYTWSAIEKEFDCFKNTYVSDKAFDIEKILDEDTIPFFAPLKLIQYKGNGYFEIRRMENKDIPLDILLYCILLDNEEHLKSNNQIGVDELLDGKCQVGRYMNIGYTTLIESLQQLENMSKLTLTNNFGNRFIQLNDTNAEQVLSKYYRNLVR